MYTFWRVIAKLDHNH